MVIVLGLSVSGAMVIVLVGFITSASVFYTYADEIADTMLKASASKYRYVLERAGTKIEIQNASYNATTKSLKVLIANTGSTTLATGRLDVLADGNLSTKNIDASKTRVNSQISGIWAPSTVLELYLNLPSKPQRLKVVTENGVAGHATVH